MKKRLLTLDDLYAYYSSANVNAHFSSDDKADNIVVQVEGNICFESSTEDSTEGLTPVVLKSCHTNLNRNKSFISEEVMTAALPSFSCRPILGFIHEVDGQNEFYSHNMHIDDDGEIVYDEVPVGIIRESSNAHLEEDEETGNKYVVVNGYLFDEYSHATEILQREGECYVSVELSIRDLTYNAKDKYLNIENFYFSGVTILGKDEDGNDVQPGMAGSNIKLADFSAENNSVQYSAQNDKLIEALEKLNDTISKFNIKDSKEGGNEMFEKLLEKYGKTAEDIEFDYSEMSDEELEAKFAELFDTEEGEDETEPTPTSDEGGEGEFEKDPVDDDDTADDGSEEDKPEEDTPEEPVDQFTKTFSISHEDIKTALYALIAPFEEADNDWYYISAVYDDYFAYEGWCTDAIYGQKYAKDGDNVALDGERYSLHRELLTDSEYAQLTEMRSNYAEIASKLEKYESEPQKAEILTSSDYAAIADTEEFTALNKDHFDLTVEEVKAKADEILLTYAKKPGFKFSAIGEEFEKTTKKQIPVGKKITKKGPYGNIFNK